MSVAPKSRPRSVRFAGSAGSEDRRRGGGRRYRRRPAGSRIRYVTEIKRELNDSAPKSLEENYIRQAAEYGHTNVPFGQLLVLHLTPHPDGTPRIDEAVWLAHHRPPHATTDRWVLLGVVTGNRPTPHDLSSWPKKATAATGRRFTQLLRKANPRAFIPVHVHSRSRPGVLAVPRPAGTTDLTPCFRSGGPNHRVLSRCIRRVGPAAP